MRDFIGLTALALALLVGRASDAGEQPIVLSEHLNRQWTGELLNYPLSASAAACHPQSVSLTGPRGPVPVQLSEVECWPGTPWVKSARLSFLADLAPLASDTDIVRFAPEPVAAAAPRTDLSVIQGEDQVEMTTSHFGVRLALLRRGAGTVILTLGQRGSMVVTWHSADHIPGQPVRAVDTTGAGDAYVGSLAYFLAAGLPLSEAARKAGAVATRSVLKSGTQTSFPDREELADIFGTGP